MTEYSLIIPVFKNEPYIEKLLKDVNSLSKRLQNKLELVLVFDSLPDGALHKSQQFINKYKYPAKFIVLGKNVGSLIAIKAGLSKASGSYFAVKAADLQEPLWLVYDFFNELSTKNCDVVIGVRISRNDGLISTFISNAFWKIYRKLIQSQIPEGGVDVFGINSKVKYNLLNQTEKNSPLIGILFWTGYRIKEIKYKRLQRKLGKSSWTIKKKLSYLQDYVYAFSTLPITLIIILGISGISLSFLLSIVTLIAKLNNTIPIPGYTTLIILLSFFSGLNLTSLGIIGSYVWRVYENTKNRPDFLIQNCYEYNQNNKTFHENSK